MPKSCEFYFLNGLSGENDKGLLQKFTLKKHLIFCKPCRAAQKECEEAWKTLFTPEPDVQESLVRVFKGLQNNETLIWKGWKLSPTPQREAWGLAEFFTVPRFAVAGAGTLVLVSVFVGKAYLTAPSARVAIQPAQPLQSLIQRRDREAVARLRVEEPHQIRVQYVEPQNWQTVEFETGHAR